MFKCELSRLKEFKSIMEGVSRIVDEMVFETDSQGLRAKALDRSHISFINFELDVDFFDEFTIDEPEKLYVDMDQLVQVLKRGKNTDTLSISLDLNNVIFTFTGESTRIFKIHQIDMEYTSPEPPILDTSVTKLPIPFNILNESIGDIGMISDKIKLTITNNELIFDGEGNYSDVSNKYLHGENLNLNNPVISNYSLDFIQHFLKISQISNIVLISVSADSPLLLNLEGDDVEVGFLLAPRLNQEE